MRISAGVWLVLVLVIVGIVGIVSGFPYLLDLTPGFRSRPYLTLRYATLNLI